ncbi:MAG TPA: RHS repeat-associated core domain-containing protein [Bryobacteraceae bacterium]|nr:RHS repeat-associated core domain-containing protein [Bryobacteraceae bacterium]HXJ41168.1 RHS repeat-associated core domain-containing protein [Bryobacteraceae bacterium]
MGSTLALTDSAGTTQTQYTYEPFGKTTSSGVSSSSTFQYTRRQNDATGLYYYRASYYYPTLGWFISEDRAVPIAPSGLRGEDREDRATAWTAYGSTAMREPWCGTSKGGWTNS